MTTMAAVGVGRQRIAKATGFSTATVCTVLKKPENQAEVLRQRELLKQDTIHRMAPVAQEGWAMAHEAAQDRDAKSFDATTRGLHAMEKIASSVSGENQRVQVEHSGTVETGSALEQLKILIGVVTAP